MKSSLKLLLIISISVIILGSVGGTLVYFFVIRDGGDYTISCSGYVKLTENNQTLIDAKIDLYGRKEDQTFKLLKTVTTNSDGYYSISESFWFNNSIVRESYFKIIATFGDELFDHEFFSSLGNYSKNFSLDGNSVLESEGRLFPTRNDSHLTYTFFSVLPKTANPPQLLTTIGCNITSGSAMLEIFDNNVLVQTLAIAFNDSYSINIPELDVTKVHSVKFKLITQETSISTLWELEYLELNNLYWSQELHKIAYFITPTIWVNEQYDGYKQLLRDHGFTTKSYYSPSTWEPILENLDYQEDENSIVFLLIGGHGNFIPYRDNGTGDSFVCINNDTGLNLYSNELEPYIENLESTRIEIMIESCFSGGFIDDLLIDGVSILTGADKEHTSNSAFTHYFFEAVNESKMDDMDAFDYMCPFFDGFWNQINFPQANWWSWHSFYYP